MYTFFQGPAIPAVEAPPVVAPRERVSRTVVFLGLTSMLTDISSEMVTAILPLYLTVGLGFTPLLFGVFEGLHQGAMAFLRIGAGIVTDRLSRHKAVAATGYALSAACKLGLFAAGSAWTTMTWLLLDRGGKSIRTPARDALIALSSQPAARGEAYGVHRALDAFGAFLGPIAAFALLAGAPGGFDLVFLVSFCFALLGLAVLLLFVEPSRTSGYKDVRRRQSTGTALHLFGIREFRAALIVAFLLSAMTISDAFIYLTVHESSGMSAAMFPLLFVGTALAYLVLAAPIGRLADRVGRQRVFVAGHVLLLVVYGLLLVPSPGIAALAACIFLLGAYYAMTDGVLMALTSSALPPALVGTGLALVTTGTAAARFGGSVLYGAMWHWYGVRYAVLLFLAGLSVSLYLGSTVLVRAGERR